MNPRIYLVDFDYLTGEQGHFSEQVLATKEQARMIEDYLERSVAEFLIENVYVGDPQSEPTEFTRFWQGLMENDALFHPEDRLTCSECGAHYTTQEGYEPGDFCHLFNVKVKPTKQCAGVLVDESDDEGADDGD